VVFLDNDTVIPDPSWLEKLRAVLHSDRRIGIVGPKLCYPFEPRRIQCAGVGISRTGRVQFRGRGETADDPRFSRVEDVQTLISACFMFRRSLYDEIGGLDEVFNPIQYEDFDFCYRARSRGYRVVYTPDPVVLHWESVTSDGTPNLRNRYVIIKHGLLFKERWRHIFENENGPRDEETQWKVIEVPSPEGMRRR
jgi:GT2 family glycosyltransferase